MSLVGSLAKVALGIAAAKGISHVLNRASQPMGQGQAQAGMPGLPFPPNPTTGGKAQAGGGLGSLLEQMTHGSGARPGAVAPSSSGGGLEALIRGLAEAATGGSGTPKEAANTNRGTFTEVLNQSFQKYGEPEVSPTPQQNAAAGLMLRAMLQAAKCDGRIDDGEKAKILNALRDGSREDMEFVNRELASPVDVQGLARQVPKGLEAQVYAVSAMGIDLDSQKEAEYLSSLSSALSIDPRQVNAIHSRLGIPALFN